MKKVIKMRNNLEKILRERDIKKSDFASIVDTTNATISNFISQERSTYNISLIEKILGELDIEVEDLFSKTKVYEFDNYESEKYYEYPYKEDYYFSYSNVPNRLMIHLLIIKDNIILEFKSSMLNNFFIVNNKTFIEDEELLKTLIDYAEKSGKSTVSVYKSNEEALEIIKLLYL